MVFTGVVAYPITPFTPDGEVNLKQLGLLVSRLAESEVDSVTVLGSSGSFAYLDAYERSRVLECALAAADGRLPVSVGISSIATRDVLTAARSAERLGAAGLVLSPVSYLPLTDDELVCLVEEVASAAGLPICLYNNPGTTQMSIDVELVGRLAAVPTLAAFKDTAASPEDFAVRAANLQSQLSRPVSHGASSDPLLATGEVAADAWHTGLAALLPASYVAFRQAVLSGDEDRISRHRSRLLPVVQGVQRLRKLSGLHALARACGIDAGDPRRPVLPVAGSEQRDLARLVDALDDVEDGLSA